MKKVIQRIGLVAATCFLAVVPGASDAYSQSSTEAATDEKQTVLEIYAATKTAKTANEFTQLVANCEQALEGELTAKNRAYVRSLKGWALNRRGGLRFEIAMELTGVGNSQGDAAMSSAMSDFDESIKADGKRWRSWLSRGIALASQGKFDAAISDFSQVTELKPDEADAWFNRAEANYHSSNFADAVADYDAVLAMQESDLQALTGRGHAYYALAKYPEALADYLSVSQKIAGNDQSFINLGDAHQMLGQWKEAEAAYDNAIKLKPTAIAMQRLAWFKATCPDATYRDPDSAQDLIEQAITLGGETPATLDTLAAVQAANGNFKTAKQTQEKVIQLVEAQTDVKPGPTEKDYRTRMAMYEEGVPYQQAKKSAERE